MKNLVSYCIPVHNAENYIGETINCLLLQEEAEVEIICVNDHSTDNTSEILKAYGNKIIFLNAEKNGAAAARNQAFLKSRGDFIVFFDADDLVSPRYTYSQLAKLRDNINSVSISRWGRFYNEISSFKEDPYIIRQDLDFHNWIIGYWSFNRHTTPPGRIMIPRPLLIKAGLWDDSLTLNDDFEFYTRVFNMCNNIIYNDGAIFYYRSGIGGLSSRVRSYEAQLSNHTSISKATRIALEKFQGDVKIRKACANIWQLFIYDNYPLHRSLIEEAKSHIKELNGSDFPFPAGGFSKLINLLFGWKAVKIMRTYLHSRPEYDK